MYVLAATSVVK